MFAMFWCIIIAKSTITLKTISVHRTGRKMGENYNDEVMEK